MLEGAKVQQGQVLVRLDLRDLVAKRQQAQAGLADVEAQRQLALVSATRLRACMPTARHRRRRSTPPKRDWPEPRRAFAPRRRPWQNSTAVASYGEIRAPFAGVVSRRFVDPGAFVAPGAPMLTVDRLGDLRISVTVPVAEWQGFATGRTVTAAIEGDTATATIEGVARESGGTYTVNAVVRNADGRFLGGSSATLRLPARTSCAADSDRSRSARKVICIRCSVAPRRAT